MLAPDDFRRLLGHFVTGVTVLTTCDGAARPTGLTVSAFCSVSLDPPLVLVCVDHNAQTYGALRDHGRFAVSILTDGQEAVSRRFATTLPDKFEGLAYSWGTLGLPLIDDALAQLECVTVSAHTMGDHTVFVGRVEHAAAGRGAPLLYYRGQYGRLAGVGSGATS